jgi:hypothetical protein
MGRAAAAGFQGLLSLRRVNEVVVDGKATEWSGYGLSSWDGFSFCVLNDEENIYLYLVPGRRDVKAQVTGLFGQSFTIWLNAKGRERKGLGVRFTFDQDRSSPFRGRGGDDRTAPRGAEAPPPLMELLMPGNMTFPLLLPSAASNVEAKTGINGSEVVFEVKVPIAELNIVNREFELGLETSKIEKEYIPDLRGNDNMMERRPQGPFGDGDGPGGGGGGPGRGGMPAGMEDGRRTSPRERSDQPPKPIRLWTPVRLADQR